MKGSRVPGPRSGGFTILEILIATAILTLGLVGILAIFPMAIHSGKKVMEQSTAVTIAKSVAEAIRSGIRNQKRAFLVQEEVCTYFIFQHDGVVDPLPRDRSLERPDGDYYILLPQFRSRDKFEGFSDQERREQSVAAAKEFVYPESDSPPNGGGDPFRARDDGRDGPGGGPGLIVKKTYRIGNFLPAGPEEEAAEPGGRTTRPRTAEAVLEDQRTDMFKQFSYAFSIRASEFDTNVSPTTATRVYIPGNQLYHVRVMVFRSFSYNQEKVLQEGKGPEPLYELDFEVAK